MGTALANASNRRDVTQYEGDPYGAQGSEGAGGTIHYVKFTGQSGIYTYGQDDDVLEHETRMVADMANAEYIWTFWWDGSVMESFTERLVDAPLSYDNPPDYLPEDPNGDIDMTLEEINKARADDPGNFRDGWTCQASFNARPIDGEDATYCFKLNEGVAMNSWHSLRKSYGRQRTLKEGLMPVVEVSANDYKPKAKNAGKKRWAPSLKIVEWMSEEDLASLVGENPDDYDTPDTAPQVEDKVEKETPKAEAETKTEAATEDKPKATGRRGRRGARGANAG